MMEPLMNLQSIKTGRNGFILLEEENSEIKKSFIEPIYTKKKYQGNCLISTDTKELFLNNEHLKKLPEPRELEQLETLECDNNKLKEIPQYAFLTRAKLRHNKLSSFPGVFLYLRYLDIGSNPLGSNCILPSGEELPSLEELYCTNTGIRELNPKGYPKLKYLDCSKNKLEYLPDEKALPLLTFLDCSNNFILVIDRYPLLKTLWCRKNKYISIPDHLPKLQAVDCKKCKLIQNPIGKELRYLDCSQNRIETLESSGNKLIWLDCSYNKLHDLPHSLIGLQYLRARGNKFGLKKMEVLLHLKVCEIDEENFGYWNPRKTAILTRR